MVLTFSHRWTNSLVLLLLFGGIEGRFYFPEPNNYEITSSIFNYPHHQEEIDIIWRFTHSISLTINEFQLDGQEGDFLLVSDLPLTFEEYFEAENGSATLPAFFPESIVTSHGLILSWELDAGKEFHILSKHGTFIYFHAEGGTEGRRGTFPYKGFNITIQNLDLMRTPPPTTTTEAVVIPPEPGKLIYVSKFLKNPAFEFRDKKDAFKTALAEIANEYCLEKMEECGQYLTDNFTMKDVSIPTETGLHMCDVTWDTFETCVEVTFAVTKMVGNVYLLPQHSLEEMWALKGHLLEEKGFFPYDDHPVDKPNIDTWIWMASLMSLLLVLMVLMCVFWISMEMRGKVLPRAFNADELDKKEDEGEGSKASKWVDIANPIRPMVQKLKRQSEAAKYLEVSNGNGVDRQDSFQTRTTTNALFQEQDVTFEFDNRGFSQNEEVEYGPGFSDMQNGRIPMENDLLDVADEEFPPRDRFLRIERGNFDETSDTEI